MQKETISFEDFNKIDLRIGTVIEVKDFPTARNPSYRIKIDFGKLGIKNSSAQITKLYSKETLLNKQVITIVNFKPKQIANFISECLILGIQNGDEVVLLKSLKKVQNGTKVS